MYGSSNQRNPTKRTSPAPAPKVMQYHDVRRLLPQIKPYSRLLMVAPVDALLRDKHFAPMLPESERTDAARAIVTIVLDALTAEGKS